MMMMVGLEAVEGEKKGGQRCDEVAVVVVVVEVSMEGLEMILLLMGTSNLTYLRRQSMHRWCCFDAASPGGGEEAIDLENPE